MATLMDKYRATHGRIRRYLNRYTDELCPACADPCCRKPTKVSEFDVLLANACGCSLPSANHAAADLVEAGMLILKGNPRAEGYNNPCDYLGEGGCVFPDDLRPYECTRYICPSLRKSITSCDMRELRSLLHKLEVIHRNLLAEISPRHRR